MSGELFLSSTESVCPECLRTISAVRLERGDEIVLSKECPEHGSFGERGGRGERETMRLPSLFHPLTPSHSLHLSPAPGLVDFAPIIASIPARR